MNTHTPGPWLQSGAYIVGQNSIHVATINGQLGNEAQANARLIAEAPELLKQLRKADEVIVALWALTQKHGIPDEAAWPMLGELQRKAAIAQAGGR